MKETDIQIGSKVKLKDSTLLPNPSRVLPDKIGIICGLPISGERNNRQRYIPCQLENGTIENWMIRRIEVINS